MTRSGASGESGIIVGAFGGTNVGIPVILGKISIGDNKVVTSIVQTVLSTAAKRAAFQATIPVLLAIAEPANSKFADILKMLIFSGKS